MADLLLLDSLTLDDSTPFSIPENMLHGMPLSEVALDGSFIDPANFEPMLLEPVPPPVCQVIAPEGKFSSMSKFACAVEFVISDEWKHRIRHKAQSRPDALAIAALCLGEQSCHILLAFILKMKILSTTQRKKTSSVGQTVDAKTITALSQLCNGIFNDDRNIHVTGVASNGDKSRQVRYEQRHESKRKFCGGTKTVATKRPVLCMGLTSYGARYARHLLGEVDSAKLVEGLPATADSVPELLLMLVTLHGSLSLDNVKTLCAEHFPDIDLEASRFRPNPLKYSATVAVARKYLVWTSETEHHTLVLPSTLPPPMELQLPTQPTLYDTVLDIIKQMAPLRKNEIHAHLFKLAESYVSEDDVNAVLDSLCDPMAPNCCSVAVNSDLGVYYFRSAIDGTLDYDSFATQLNERFLTPEMRQCGMTIFEPMLRACYSMMNLGQLYWKYAIDESKMDSLVEVRNSELPFLNVGRGLFVRRDLPFASLPRGTLFPVVGEVIPDAELPKNLFLDYGFKCALSNNEEYVINTNPASGITCVAAYVNDPKNNGPPNAEPWMPEDKPELWLTLKRDVSPGEEILWSYGDQYWQAHDQHEEQNAWPGDVLYNSGYDSTRHSFWQTMYDMGALVPPETYSY